MAHGYTTEDGWFVDPLGRRTLLRGVNLGGSTKVPHHPDGATQRGVDLDGWRTVSFVGRPAPLDELDRHLDRIVHWGFNVLRLLVTWEAIEHAGPEQYDEPYLDYVREVCRRAGEHGLLVFIDPHHDVWSRWTGGDGAPFWCFEWAGLLPDRFGPSGAVKLDAFDWPSNYDTVPVATMWTLFYGGDTFCPQLPGVQEALQTHYLAAICEVARRVCDLDNVLGYDTLNEPSTGYIGRGGDLARGQRRFDKGDGSPEPWSPIEMLAAAAGNALQRGDDGPVLNREAISVWSGSCPWADAGVWDWDADGQPKLANPAYFNEIEGQPVHAWRDFVVPFITRFRDTLRGVHPDCLVFIEGAPHEFDTPWQDDDALICNARHWYDIVTLARRRFDPTAYRAFTGDVLSGVDAISDSFTRQLAGLKGISRERMGNPPMLIGEFGIPYEMNDGEAYVTGDYSKHELLLDANYRAMDAVLLSSTQWNYTADNTHAYGDQWNHEDLSIFSADDQAADTAPDDLDAGGRAVRGFCRPYARHAAGTPTRMAFDPATGVFELTVDADADLSAPTEIYLPRLHYPAAPATAVSAGYVEHDPAAQVLRWHHQGARGEITLRASRA